MQNNQILIYSGKGDIPSLRYICLLSIYSNQFYPVQYNLLSTYLQLLISQIINSSLDVAGGRK